MKKLTKKALVLVFLYSFLFVTVMLAQNPAKATDPPSPPQESNQPAASSSISEETGRIIEKLQKKLEKLEEKFKKDKADLEEKIAKETKEESKKKLQDRLAEKQAKFDEEKKLVLEQIDSLKKIGAEKQTRNPKNYVMAGACGNLLTYTGDIKRVLETMGTNPMCEWHPATRVDVHITDASNVLQASRCFRGFGQNSPSGTFDFMAPGIIVLRYCNITGSGCKTFIFMERMDDLNRIIMKPEDHGERDNVLYHICNSFGQVVYPLTDAWEQVPVDVGNGNTQYEYLISGFAGGAGGISSVHIGLGGTNSLKEGQGRDPLAFRSIVVDPELARLLTEEGNIWKQIGEGFESALGGPMAKYSELYKFGEGVFSAAKNDGARRAAKTLLGEYEKKWADNVDFKGYLEYLKKASDAPGDKHAKKYLYELLKKLGKDEKALDKIIKPMYAPLKKVEDFRGQLEFISAGEAMGDLLKSKSNPTNAANADAFKELVEKYRTFAASLSHYLEKVRPKLAMEWKPDEFSESLTIKAGEKLLVLASITGASYDFETQKTKLKAIDKEDINPANDAGEVDKNAGFVEGRRMGLVKIDELIAKGFDRAVIQSKDGISIAEMVKGNNGLEMFLRHFVDEDGATTEEMSLVDLRDKARVPWLPFIIRDRRLAESMIPSESTRFLPTFNFLDKESHRLTVMFLMFDTVNSLVFRKADGSQVVVKYYLHPGIYRESLKVVDSLEFSPKKREIKLPPIIFRVLPPTP